jgi:diguanylate cyclase (GGDEF)-like protein
LTTLYFDTRTAVFMLMGVCFILGISMNLVLLKRKTYPGFGWWTVGITSFAFAFIFLLLRNIIPDIFSIVLANILQVLASLLFLEGTRLFRGKEVRKIFIVLVLIVYTIFQSYFTFVDNQLSIRIIVISFLLGTMFGLTGLELLLNVPPILHFSYWITGSLFAVFSIFMFARGTLTIIFPPSQDLLAPGFLHSLTFIIAMLFGICWTIRFIILNGERLEDELKSTQVQLQKMATTDFLTGIANYRLFLELGEREIQRALRYKNSLSMLMIDLDYFKKVNDNYGHAAGDKVLVAFAAICKKNLRDFDIFGRLGGEEFAIILPQTNLNEGKILAERLCAIIAQSDFDAGDKNLRITISIGVSELLAGEDKLDEVLKRADDAMYEANRNGRNQVSVAL